MAKVLLVEDDNNLREIYEARLQAEGYDIVAARDGEEALVVAKGEMPDLVISDVMMPKISGFEMLDILRATDGLKDVKVIMLTALGQAEDQTRAESLGADRYLVKSQVTLEDIVNAAKELLGETTDAPVADPVPAAPAPAPAEPVAAPATPVPPAPEPIVAPVVTPVAAPDPTPVIPLAAPPEEPEAPDVSPQMPPTPASTVPDVSTEEEVTTVPEPAPQPVTEPIVPVDAVPQTAEAQSSQEESTVVEQQISSFVDSQSGQPAPAAEPTTPEQEQALNDALETLNSTADDDAVAEPSGTESSAKRIIQPIEEDDSKKSLQDLLKEEEAREMGLPVTPTAPPAPTAPVQIPVAQASEPTPQPSAPAPTPAPASPTKPNGDFDPHSIAL